MFRTTQNTTNETKVSPVQTRKRLLFRGLHNSKATQFAHEQPTRSRQVNCCQKRIRQPCTVHAGHRSHLSSYYRCRNINPHMERSNGRCFSQRTGKHPKPLPTCAQNGVVQQNPNQGNSTNHSSRFPFGFIRWQANDSALFTPFTQCGH